MSKVNWTVKALRRLRATLTGEQCQEQHKQEKNFSESNGCTEVLQQKLEQINPILERTFPNAKCMVVQDQLTGFRRKPDLYILLVEVFTSDEPGSYIVKIGAKDRLNKEIQGWNSCRPEGLRHDLVFLPLVRGDDTDPTLMSLVYGDAQQFIGVENTTTFESAALQSIRFGFPSTRSVGFTIMELFERIGHLLYVQSCVDDPSRDNFVFNLHKLKESMEIWKKNAQIKSIRTDVNIIVNRGISKFFDPVDYLRYIQNYVPWKTNKKETCQKLSNNDAEENKLPIPKPEDLIPRMLRGCAHGDLHGRNILVGIVRDSALWPVVFDYEDMSPHNFLGWDFVKLETESKIRVYNEIFPHQETSFIQAVQKFEIELNEQTEKHHLDGSWPAVQDETKPSDLTLDETESASMETCSTRLRAILLEIRHMASIQLGRNRGRPHQWLEEYYFLLACYGVTTTRFENLERRELIGAYVSAGVATARLSWPRYRAREEMRILDL
jgi:hypothetical protein